MAISRKIRREQLRQARKALRIQLKDKVVQQHVKEEVNHAFRNGFDEGRQYVVGAAFGLTYE